MKLENGLIKVVYIHLLSVYNFKKSMRLSIFDSVFLKGNILSYIPNYINKHFERLQSKY